MYQGNVFWITSAIKVFAIVFGLVNLGALLLWVERRQSAFPHDDRVNEFDGDVLSVRRIGSPPEREETATCEKPLGHVATGQSESRRLS